MRLLLEAKADVVTWGGEWFESLPDEVAASRGCPDVVRLLLDSIAGRTRTHTWNTEMNTLGVHVPQVQKGKESMLRMMMMRFCSC